MTTEPARLIGYGTAIATAVIALAVAFGANITADQKNAILGTVAAIAPVVVLAVETIRAKVTPSATAAPKKTAQAIVNQAAANQPGAPIPKV